MVSLLSIKTYQAQESSVYVHITIALNIFQQLTWFKFNIKMTSASSYIFLLDMFRKFLQKSEEGSTNYTNIQILRKALFKNAKYKIMGLDSHFPFRVHEHVPIFTLHLVRK